MAEIETYRYYGHSMSDPGTSYRTRDEIQDVRKNKDPISGLKADMLEWELVTEAELKEIDLDVRAEVDAATQYALTTPELEPEDMYNQIYNGMEGTRIRGADAMTYGIHMP